MIRKVMLAAATLATLGASASAPVLAQYAPYQYRVAFVRPEVARFRVSGWVSNFDRFNMTMRADGRTVPVNLHQGTVILPTGLTLEPGMFVSIDGFWSDNGFQADRIVLIR